MGIFGPKPLDYRTGNGSLARLKSTKYFPHHLPGEPTLSQMDFELLQEEARSGKNEELIKATVGVFDAILKPGFDFVKAIGCLKNAAPQIIPTKLGDMRLPCPTLRSTDAELKNLAKAVEELESHPL